MWRNKRLIIGAVAGVLAWAAGGAAPASAYEWWDISVVEEGLEQSVPSVLLLPSGEPALCYVDYWGEQIRYAWFDGAEWHTSVVDSTPFMGFLPPETSAAVLPSGNPALCYKSFDGLEYAWLDGDEWQTSTVISSAPFHCGCSLKILPSGQPAIAYDAGGLHYAQFTGTEWEITLVDEAAQAPLSLAVSSTGAPAIAYHDTDDNLRYAINEGDGFVITVVDDGESVYDDCAIGLTMLSDDKPAISYRNIGQGLCCAWFHDGGWELQTVDSDWDAGQFNSIATLPTGEPAIAYDLDEAEIWYAWREAESAWHVRPLPCAAPSGEKVSLAISESGAIAIGFGNVSCARLMQDGHPLDEPSQWRIMEVDEGVGLHVSLAVLPDGEPAVAYVADDSVKYAWLENDVWSTTTVEEEPGHGYYGPSLAIQPSGRPAISYTKEHYSQGWHFWLTYAAYDGASWNEDAVVDHSVGQTGLAYLPSGHPAIAFDRNEDAAYAYFDGVEWHVTSWETLWVSRYNTIRITPSGDPALGWVAYHMGMGTPYYRESGVYFGSISGGRWSAGGFSLAILPSGQPVALFGGKEDEVATQSTLAYSWLEDGTWNHSDVRTFNVYPDTYPQWRTSLAVLPSGQPAFSYFYSDEGLLWFAWLEDDAWHMTVVDGMEALADPIHAWCSLTILPYGEPAIAYCDPAKPSVKYAVRLRLADMNCDGDIDFFDIDGFVLAVTDPAGYAEEFPGCERFHADCNGDGAVNFFDIDAFVALITGGSGV